MPQMPYYYNPYQTPQPMMNTPQNVPQNTPQVGQSNRGGGINWCQGEAGAKAYPVAPNTSELIMDSEEPVFYIKNVDASGMPLPLRVFDYTERTAQNAHRAAPVAQTDAVTREEFERLREEVTRLTKGVRKPQVNNKNDKEG